MRYLFAVAAVFAAVAMFVFLAKEIYIASVEAEMQATAVEALRAAGLGEVEVSFVEGAVRFGGLVVDPAQREEARQVVAGAIPLAQVPQGEEALRRIGVRPTRQPELTVRRGDAPDRLTVEGRLGRDREKAVDLLASRLVGLEGIAELADETEHDETRMLLEGLGSYVSVAAELFRHEGGERAVLREERFELVGEIPHEGVRELLVELAESAGATVEDRLSVAPSMPPPPPAELEIVRNRFGLVFSGRVSGEEVRRRLADAAAHATMARVSDQLAVDPSTPEAAWEGRAEELLLPLLGLADGEASLAARGEVLRLAGRVPEGEASTLAAAYEVLAKDSGWALEVALEESETAAEPARAGGMRMEAGYEGGLLKLKGVSAGFAGTSALGERLRERLSDRLPDLLVKEEWTAPNAASGEGTAGEGGHAAEGSAEGAEDSEPLADALIEFFEEVLPRAEALEILVGGDRLRLAGIVFEPADRQIVENAAFNAFGPVAAVENELALESEVAAEAPLSDAERAALASDLEALPVYFAINSDLLDRDARSQVAKIVELLGEPRVGTPLVVAGFADNIGNPERNRQLSLQRAEAVKRELVEAGWEREWIELDSKTLNAASIPRSERWKARRVEVSLQD